MVLLDERLPKVPDGALHPDLVLVAGSSGHRSRIGAHKAPEPCGPKYQKSLKLGKL